MKARTMDDEGAQDSVDLPTGLVWREEPPVVGATVVGFHSRIPTQAPRTRKPDLDMERLALFAAPAPEGMLPEDSAIREAGRAVLRERKAKNTCREALRRLV